jgi:hypothetical protein
MYVRVYEREREESGPTRHGRNTRQHKAIVVEATTYLSYGAAAARVFSDDDGDNDDDYRLPVI